MKETSNIYNEYNSIKTEIQNKIELHNNLITFTITTVVAVLAFAFSQSNPFLFLLPFCIIIPMSLRIAYYRLALSKLSAYLIVFIEPELNSCKWETRNYLIIDKNNRNNKDKIKSLRNSITMNYYDCLILGIISYVLFLYHYLSDIEFGTLVIINIIWPLILIIYELMVTVRINSADKKKTYWIIRWSEQKHQEYNCC